MQLLGDALTLFHQAQPAQLGLRPPILDSHRGLVRERFHEPDPALVEAWVALQPGHHQGAGGAARNPQGNEDCRPMPAQPHDGLKGAGVGADVVQ